MRLPATGARVRWRTYDALDDHHGVVLWAHLVPPGPQALLELVGTLRRLRQEGVRPLPRPGAVLRVGRGILVEVRDYRGRRRVFTPWMRRLLPEEAE